ncbi:recombinase family protein, partial [Vibrio sp. 10N.222.55.C6]
LLKDLENKYDTTVSDLIYNDEGVSSYKGKNVSHGELGRLLTDIERGVIKKGDIIVVRHLDRLSRLRLTGAMTIYNKIMEAGVLIHTTMDD